MDTSEINHLCFYEENADLLFAASNDHVRLWNVETNKQLDCLSLPPRTITDMKVAPFTGDSGLLLVSAIQKETISIYFSHLANINFDESIDMLPEKVESFDPQSVRASGQDYQQDISYQQPVNVINEPQQDVIMQNQAPATHEDADTVSRMTYIQAPKNEPINLNMSEFGNQQLVADAGMAEKKDIDIINECMDKHDTFKSVMQRRISNVKVVQNYIINSDLVSALNSMNMIKDPTVSMDILNSTFAKGKRLDMLNFEKVKLLMPHI